MTRRADTASSRVMRALALAAFLCLSCAAPAATGLPAARPDAPARLRLRGFLSAVEGARWTDAHALLSARWRGRLTPAGLARDHAAAGSMGVQAVARARASLDDGTSLDLRGRTALLPVGPGRAAVLVEEGGDWFVDAVE